MDSPWDGGGSWDKPQCMSHYMHSFLAFKKCVVERYGGYILTLFGPPAYYCFHSLMTTNTEIVLFFSIRQKMASNTANLPAETSDTTKKCPSNSWEVSLTAAPTSLSIMGGLVYVSTGKDFSINYPPKEGFKHIKYPESFMSCLMQVCNSSWCAFNEAHKNMDMIRIHTATVPKYMHTGIRIISNGSDKMIKKLLPHQLNSIQRIADDCLILAQAVENKYLNVNNLIMELLEASQYSKTINEKSLKVVEENRTIAEKRKKESEEWDKQYKIQLQNLSSDLKKGEDEHQQSLNSLPSGWDMINMDIVEGLTCPLKSLKNLITGGQSAGDRAAENARTRIEKSEEYLNDKRKSYENHQEKIKQNQIELDAIMKELYSCDVDKVEFDTVISLLNKGLHALGMAQEQWQKMVGLFQMISVIVKCSLNRTLKDFTTKADMSELDSSDRIFVNELLSEQVTEASDIARMVHTISGTYTVVSNNYLMDRVGCLSKLLAMDKTSEEFKKECKKLEESCEEARRDIHELILKNKAECESNLSVEGQFDKLMGITLDGGKAMARKGGAKGPSL